MGTVNNKQRTVAITGAGGGLGRATALAFAAKGYRVFGTARKAAEISELSETSRGVVKLKLCDITDESAVAAWAEDLQKIASEFTDEQRKLYGKSFGAFAEKLNTMQGAGMSAEDSAARLVEIAEQVPAPVRAGVGPEAEEILKYVHDAPIAEQDI